MIPYKSIKFTQKDHKAIRDLARELKSERGGKVYLPGAVLEAVKFYREHRHRLPERAAGGADSSGERIHSL